MLRLVRGEKIIIIVLHLRHVLQYIYLTYMQSAKLQRESFNENVNTTANLSFSIFTATALLLVHLQRPLSTIKNERKKQKLRNRHHFPSVSFQVALSWSLQLLLLKFPYQDQSLFCRPSLFFWPSDSIKPYHIQ